MKKCRFCSEREGVNIFDYYYETKSIKCNVDIFPFENFTHTFPIIFHQTINIHCFIFSKKSSLPTHHWPDHFRQFVGEGTTSTTPTTTTVTRFLTTTTPRIVKSRVCRRSCQPAVWCTIWRNRQGACVALVHSHFHQHQQHSCVRIE